MRQLLLCSLGLASGLVLAFAVGASVGAPQGALAQESCNPSYPGICIRPSEGDYDCAGSGDGPNHVVGPIDVLPPDPHGLDPNGNGIGCEEGEVSAADGNGSAAQQTAVPTAAGASGNTTPQPSPTSDVAAVSVAGFGPGDIGAGNQYSWLIAGLTGAGIAWVLSGVAAARLVSVRRGNLNVESPSPSNDEGRPFFVKLRPVHTQEDSPRSRPRPGKSAPPPLVPPPTFKTRER